MQLIRAQVVWLVLCLAAFAAPFPLQAQVNGGFITETWTGGWGSDGPIFTGDLNGDGKTDVFMWRDSDKSWIVNLSTGSGFTTERWTGGWGSDGPIFTGDLNGDGKTDVFMWRDSDKSWIVNLSTGSGFTTERWTGGWGSDGPIFTGDLNGDGKTDVFMWRDSDKSWIVNLSTGSGFTTERWTGGWGSDGPIFTGDLNGDGKTDVFMWRDSDKSWIVNLSTGSGFTTERWTGGWGSDGPIFTGDLNGDGKTDVFMWRDSDKSWIVNLSTGSGFTTERRTGGWGSDGPIFTGDLNGDGKTDVFMWRDSDKSWIVNLSTGSGFTTERRTGGWGSDGPIFTGDLNGDGKTDVFMWRDSDKSWIANLATQVTNPVDVLTQHNNNYRDGVQGNETTLTPSLVRTFGMDLQHTLEIDTSTDTQPLYVKSVHYKDGPADSIYVVSQANTLYNFNAQTGQKIWETHLSDPESSSRAMSNDNPPTPVIDRGLNVIYVLYSFANKETDLGRDGSGHTRNTSANIDALLPTLDIAFWLTAFDLTTGEKVRTVKIGGSAEKADGSIVSFDARVQESHPALLLDHGSIYLGFGADAAWEPVTSYHGWVFRYDEQTFQAKGVFCTTPEEQGLVNEGGGIWQGGGGLASDQQGNIYFMVGNAPADPSHNSFGDSFIRLAPSGNSLTLAGFLIVPEAGVMDDKDLDLGSGGLVVLPGTSLLVGGGKTGMLYSVDGANMNRSLSSPSVAALRDSFQMFTNVYHPNGAWDYGCPNANDMTCQSWMAGPHLHGSPIYWNGRIYDSAEKDHMKSTTIDKSTGSIGRAIRTGVIQATSMMMPGGLSSLSANQDDVDSGIVWSVIPAPGRSLLLAYDANTLELIWEEKFPDDVRRMSHRGAPTIADGQLIVPSASGAVLVYTLGKQPQGAVQITQPTDSQASPSMMVTSDRFNQVGNKIDRIAPPLGEHPMFRVRSTINGNMEGFEGGFKNGLTWHADDGSSITAELAKSVIGPDPTASPWALYRVTSKGGSGRLSQVDWIEQIDTEQRGATYIFFSRNVVH